MQGVHIDSGLPHEKKPKTAVESAVESAVSHQAHLKSSTLLVAMVGFETR